MMKTTLGKLDEGTIFTYERKRYKKGIWHRLNQTKCKPFLGGRFQENEELGVWLSDDAEVEVR